MKRLYSAASLILMLTGALSLSAQITCQYRLEMYDRGKDGWEGAELTLTVAGEPMTYTVEDGAERLVSVPVADGDPIAIDYLPGSADLEVTFAFYDPEGNLLYEDGPFPEGGQDVFSTSAICLACPAPSLRTIRAGDVRAFRADIQWQEPTPDVPYVVEFDTLGFTRGTGRVVAGEEGMARLNDLAQRTDYEFYVYGLCGPEDTTAVQGPFSFRTLWANDVGISDILGPASDCDLSTMDTVTVALANFGGLPQTLIPFKFSVNEIDGGVPVPFDGFYTGSLGKDSVAIIDFETTFNFSNPGEYEIVAWTELEGDSNPGNDTAVIRVTSVPSVAAFPYFTAFEDWPSGWTVDPQSRFPSWAYGQPAGLVITGASGGSGAWVTNLTGPYQADERSYLLSPCLDFSILAEDPRLSFNLNLNLEPEEDSLLVELSLDDGQTWSVVGEAGSGLNWYNSGSGDFWTGTRPWTLVAHPLEGAAGAAEARLRISLITDNSVELEGAAVDNVFIGLPFNVDLAATGASHLGADNDCGLDQDELSLQVTNLGTQTLTGFNVAYRIDGGTTVIENAENLSVAPGEAVTYTFETPFASSGFEPLEVEAWVSAPNEAFFPNDTTRLRIATARSLPFVEDFEGGMLPPGWTADDGVTVTDGHGNLTQVLAFELSQTDPDLAAVTPAFGPVAAEDSLTFDYRFVLQEGDGSLPKELAEGDSLLVQFSTDCGETYTTVRAISAGNHEAGVDLTTASVPLQAVGGATVKVRFLATWGADAFFVDIDNINVRRCPGNLALQPIVDLVSGPGTRDGAAAVEPGAGIQPFSYFWSTGETSRTIRNLDPGTYDVVVTDNFGCIDSLEVEVGILSSTRMPSVIEAFQLAPNPTRGQSRLQVSFREPVRTRVQVLGLMGQLVWESTPESTSRLDEMLDLSALSPGVYFIRVFADDRTHTEKLILAR